MCVGASVHTLPPELCRYVCILTHLYRVCRNKNKGAVNHSAAAFADTWLQGQKRTNASNHAEKVRDFCCRALVSYQR